MNIFVEIKRNLIEDSFELSIFKKINDKLFLAIPQEIKWKEVKEYSPGSFHPKDFNPFLKIYGGESYEILAELARELAKHGFKSSEGEKELKSILEATKNHLEDMRTLVFKK